MWINAGRVGCVECMEGSFEMCEEGVHYHPWKPSRGQIVDCSPSSIYVNVKCLIPWHRAGDSDHQQRPKPLAVHLSRHMKYIPVRCDCC